MYLFCYTSHNGLNLTSLLDLNVALSYKIWWNFRTQPSFWHNFLEYKYGSFETLEVQGYSSTTPVILGIE